MTWVTKVIGVVVAIVAIVVWIIHKDGNDPSF